jgi:hypothetical protein
MAIRKQSVIVTEYARMWPRVAFELTLNPGELYAKEAQIFAGLGVCILYRDDHPYYIGKANNMLNRIRGHAINVQDTYYFWNYVSAFAVPNSAKRNELEGILIAAMPTTANGAEPKQLSRVPLTLNTKRLMQAMRQGKVVLDEKASR